MSSPISKLAQITSRAVLSLTLAMTLMGVIPARMSAQAASTEGTGPNQLASISLVGNTSTSVTAGNPFTATITLLDDGKDASGNLLRSPLAITGTTAYLVSFQMSNASAFSMSVESIGNNGNTSLVAGTALTSTTGPFGNGVGVAIASNSAGVVPMGFTTTLTATQGTHGITATVRITPTKSGSYNFTASAADKQVGFLQTFQANLATVVVAQTTANHLTVAGPSSATDSLAFAITVTAYDVFTNLVTTLNTSTLNISLTVGAGSTPIPATQFARVSDNTTGSGNEVSAFTGTMAAGSFTDNFRITTKITNVVVTASLQTAPTLVPACAGCSSTYSATTAFSVSGVVHNFLINFWPMTNARAGETVYFTVTARDNQSSTVALAAGKTVLVTSPLFPATTLTFNGSSASASGTAVPTLAGSTIVTTSIGSPEIITTTSSAYAGSGNVLTVTNGLPTKLKVEASSSASAGEFKSITVTVQDSNNNTVKDTATAYSATTGKFTLESSLGTGSTFILPTEPTGPLTTTATSPGIYNFLVALLKNGSQTIKVTWNYQSLNGTSASVVISSAAAATGFYVSPTVSNVQVGKPFDVKLTAKDDGNNTITSFTGTVTLSSKNGSIALATGGTTVAFTTTDAGVKTVSIVLGTITALEVVTATLTTPNSPAVRGASGNINVYGDVAKFIAVASVASIKAGQGFTLTLTAQDALNSTVSNFAGTVTLLSNGTISPTSVTFLASGNGVLVAKDVKLYTLGNNYITATAASLTATGSTTAISVSVGDLNNFAFTVATTQTTGVNTSVTIQARDPGNNNRNTDNLEVSLSSYLGLNSTGFAQYGQLSPTGSNVRLSSGVWYITLTNGTATFTTTFLTPGSQVLRASYTSGGVTSTGDSASLTVAAAATALTDITTLSAASQAAITELINLGITTGTSTSTFSPAANVTREQMAAFMARSYDYVAFPTAAATPVISFTDVLTSSFAYTSIQKIFGLGITLGCGGTLYCPAANVTREQMALFLSRLYKSLTGVDATLASVPFTDIGSLSLASTDAIRRIYGLGITTGTTATTYGPAALVTREQMALFLTRLTRLFP